MSVDQDAQRARVGVRGEDAEGASGDSARAACDRAAERRAIVDAQTPTDGGRVTVVVVAGSPDLSRVPSVAN